MQEVVSKMIMIMIVLAVVSTVVSNLNQTGKQVKNVVVNDQKTYQIPPTNP